MAVVLLRKADVLQTVARLLTREEAGRLLTMLCKDGAAFVRAADAQEDAGQPVIWQLVIKPMWHNERVQRRIDERGYTANLGRVLKSLADAILWMHKWKYIELVFDRAATCDGVMPVLGAHALRLRPSGEYNMLTVMQKWMGDMYREEWAQETVRSYCRRNFRLARKKWLGSVATEHSTQLVINLLQMLGLQPR
jgi:hypothetical protein